LRDRDRNRQAWESHHNQMSQFDATTTCPANLNLPEVLPLLPKFLEKCAKADSLENPEMSKIAH